MSRMWYENIIELGNRLTGIPRINYGLTDTQYEVFRQFAKIERRILDMFSRAITRFQIVLTVELIVFVILEYYFVHNKQILATISSLPIIALCIWFTLRWHKKAFKKVIDESITIANETKNIALESPGNSALFLLIEIPESYFLSLSVLNHYADKPFALKCCDLLDEVRKIRRKILNDCEQYYYETEKSLAGLPYNERQKKINAMCDKYLAEKYQDALCNFGEHAFTELWSTQKNTKIG